MKYEIKHSCGHTETVDICGKAADREKRVAYLSSHECIDCRNSEGCDAVEMHYSEYKEKYADCHTKKGSYNSDTKTIVVFVPVKTEAAESPITAEEATTILNSMKAPSGTPFSGDMVERLISMGADAVEKNVEAGRSRLTSEQLAWDKQVISVLRRIR